MSDDMKDRIGRVIAFGMGLGDTPEEIACSVLQALREPTEAMIDAGDELCPIARGTESYRGIPVPEDTWRAMIDAAQKEASDDDPCHGPEDTTCPSCGLGQTEATHELCHRLATYEATRLPNMDF